MLILIHGDDVVASRKTLEFEKNKVQDAEIINFSGKELELADLITADRAVSLFQNQKVIVIENLFSSGKTGLKENLLSYLNKNKTTNKIIIWEKNQVDKVQIKKYLSIAREIICQPPLLLFRFLESLGGEKIATLSLFHSLLKQREAELIFSMLLRQIRTLIMVKDLGETGLPSMQKWQIFKFGKQARLFSLEELIKCYRSLLAIDHQVKFGLTPLSYMELLDIYLINL